MKTAALILLAAASATLTGCANDNDRLTLGDTGTNNVSLPAIEPGPALTPAKSRSVSTMDRADWPETPAPVYMDRVQAWGSSNSARRASTARHQGRFPTPEEAVSLGPTTWWPNGPTSWDRAPAPAPAPGPAQPSDPPTEPAP